MCSADGSMSMWFFLLSIFAIVCAKVLWRDLAAKRADAAKDEKTAAKQEAKQEAKSKKAALREANRAIDVEQGIDDIYAFSDESLKAGGDDDGHNF